MVGDKPMRDWRNELTSTTRYKKAFAWFPKKIGNEMIWWKNYYKKYVTWGFENDSYGHTEMTEELTEDVYLVRKLSENL